jgi:glycosyltransferase involved in cell wall biosynthesis
VGGTVRVVMRVLLVGPEPPPFGGMAVQGKLLRERLAEAGVEVVFLPTNGGVPGPFSLPVLRTLYGLVAYGTGLLRWVRRGVVVHHLSASGNYFRLRSLPLILWCRLRGVRCVVNYRGGLAESFFRRSGWWALPVLRKASLVTVPSGFLERIFRGFDVATTVVPNICELERFSFRERPSPKPTILVNRNFEPIYNVGLALDAFRLVKERFPDATLTVAGTGSEEANLKAKAAALGVDGIDFVGRVDHAGMPALFDRHDVYVNPTNVDNMPISILESFASGIYVVSTDVGGVPDLMTHDAHGLLVPGGDAPAMAAAIERVLTDDAFRKGVQARARARAASFEWTRIRSRLLAALED